MKLIDLLVKELPKQGGWPEKAELCIYYGGGQDVVYFWTEQNNKACQPKKMRIPSVIIYDEITKEQYESALAASKQPEWNGFGLPPVGQKCQRSAFGDDWAECEVLYVGPEVIVVSVEGREKAYKNCAIKFSLLPTAADEARYAIAELCRASASNGHSADLIYDAIAAGKIPGIRLTDDAGN